MYFSRKRVDTVILYSGGMDSLMLAHKYPDALPLYVSVRSRYTDKEMACLPSGVTVVPNVLDLAAFERPDAIIPGRNLMLALVAAQFGDTIMLGATAGDASRDKDAVWASLAASVMSYMFSGRHFEADPWHPAILLPFKHHSKPQLVKEYLDTGGSVQALLDSVSCYDPTHLHCGHCKSCVRKWVALEANGIRTLHRDKLAPSSYWANDPRTSPVWFDVLAKYARGETWRGPVEDEATKRVLRAYGVLPEEVQ